jgi:hypothetical protein
MKEESRNGIERKRSFGQENEMMSFDKRWKYTCKFCSAYS